MTDVTTEFGAMLQRHREQLGWTQEKLAAEAALSAEAVSALERGTRRFPQKHTIERLVGALGLTGAERAEFLATVPRAVRRRSGNVNSGSGADGGSRPTVPRQLPAAVTEFTGRTDQLRQLTDLLARPPSGHGAAVAAITGMGGVGKTALAVKVAYAVADRYPDGQIYLDLRGYGPDDPMTAIDALGYLLRSLGTPSDEIPVEVSEAAAKFRSAVAARRVLIVLDNARDSTHVDAMLPGTPECGVIVTSRRLLAALPNTRDIRLRSLKAADGVQMLRTLAGEARIDQEAAAAAEVVRLCGSLPLAIRMAGARLATRPEWPVAHLARRLKDEQGTLNELERDDTGVRTSFAVSLDHLAGSRDAQDQLAAETFTLLGLLDGPDISLDVAARLADRPESDTERTLERLVDLHLLEVLSPGRYRLHDLLRTYSRERATTTLAQQERAAATIRILNLYVAAAWRTVALAQPYAVRLNWADPAWPADSPEFDGLADGIAWLDRHRPHLVQAVRRAASTAGHASDLAVRLAIGLFTYYATRRHWLDWQQVAGPALEVADRGTDWVATGLLRADLGLALARLAEEGFRSYDEAVEQLRRSALTFQHHGDVRLEAACLVNMTLVLGLAGRFQEAIASGQRSLTLNRERHDLNGQAMAHANLGEVHGRSGDTKRQLACFEASLLLLERAGSTHHRAEVLERLGTAYRKAGLPKTAITSLRRASHLYQQAGDPLGAASAAEQLAVALMATGAPAEAVTELERALAIAEQHDDGRLEASIRRQLGAALMELERPDEAEAQLGIALEIYESRNMAAAVQVREMLDKLTSSGID